MDKPRRRVWWDEYASREFEGFDPESTIAMLPIAAIEQHGPHLPVGVDAAINRGMLETLIDRLPEIRHRSCRSSRSASRTSIADARHPHLAGRDR